jgi:hypothetical protein
MPRGRPPENKNTQAFMVRIPEKQVKEIIAWGKRQEGLITRSESVRQLVNIALEKVKTRDA